MAGLKEIRTRIASVKSTRQITSAMKMVAAAKLRKAQDKIIQLRPYVNKLEEILTSLTQQLSEEDENRYMSEREVDRVLVVVIASNRGLCGAFNANVVKHTLSLVQGEYSANLRSGEIKFFTIGKKVTELLKLKGLTVVESNNDILDNLSYQHVIPIADKLIQQYLDGEYDRIEIVYNHFKNAAVQLLTQEQFLPVKFETTPEAAQHPADYIYEPDHDSLIESLIPRSLRIQLFKAILDSYVAEQGARMTAMHLATDNATELLRELTLHYNKARQAAITKEILEIVSGAEALKE
jgi:F-type H+-transporting ATPase subunit gamma